MNRCGILLMCSDIFKPVQGGLAPPSILSTEEWRALPHKRPFWVAHNLRTRLHLHEVKVRVEIRRRANTGLEIPNEAMSSHE